ATLQDGIPASRLITRQRRFQMDDGGDLHEQILHAEAHIEELTDRATSEDHPYFKSRHCCRRNLDLGNNHRSGRVRSYDPDWVTCGGYWRDGRFWVKREHFEANYDRHESCRGIQKRVDRPNGSSDRPVHVKTLRNQKPRMLLIHRNLLQSKAIAQ